MVDLVAIIELGTENKNDVKNMLKTLENSIKIYNNGMNASTLTVFINDNLLFLMEPESNISIVIDDLITKLSTMSDENEMFWDTAIENVGKVLKGENPNPDASYEPVREPTYDNYDSVF